MCGVVGILGPGDVASEIYESLIALQHRGQDAAGIVTYNSQFHLEKNVGLVRDALTPDRMKRLTGRIGVGHVRYPTVGGGGIEDAQPFLLNSPYGIAMVHNGNVTNFHSLKDELIAKEHRYVNSNCDVEVILNVFAQELPLADGREFSPQDVFRAAEGVFRRDQGSYSVVGMIADKGLFAFRDPYGIKPLILGEKTFPDGKKGYCVTSESVVLDILEYGRARDLHPGEAVFIDMEGNLHSKQVMPQDKHHPCIFEWVYFARPDSTIDDISVYKSRLRLGEELAGVWQETGLKADVVIPVPDSARPAALAMSRVLGIPYREGLVKNRYIGRTFIMPGQENRKRSVKYKLNPIRLEFEGKDVLIVDDSIVRGTTSRQIVQMARQAGANKVYLASYSPPIKYPCVYGIDMATRSEFIARDHSVEEICRQIGADALIYQSLEGLHRAVKEGNPDIPSFCDACFTGNYPTGDVTSEILEAWEKDRGPK